MQLQCEVCASPLRAEDVRLDIAVAKCHACNAIYDLSGRKARGLGAGTPRPRLQRAKAAMPERFLIEDDGLTTRISWRWFGLKYIALAFFCVAWDSFLLFWYGIALTDEGAPWIMLVFPVAHVAIGVGLTYTTLAGLLNTTTIEVNRNELSIRHAPLPWKGTQTLPGRSLAQLYGEEVIHTNKGRRTGTSYNLLALNREGRKVKLVSGLEEKDQVLYLEQALERRLGIEDAPVDGEVATRTQVA